MNLELNVKTALIICQLIGRINMKDLTEIQIEIKKELGGVSLNHLISWFMNQCLVKLYFGYHVANPTTY